MILIRILFKLIFVTHLGVVNRYRSISPIISHIVLPGVVKLPAQPADSGWCSMPTQGRLFEPSTSLPPAFPSPPTKLPVTDPSSPRQPGQLMAG